MIRYSVVAVCFLGLMSPTIAQEAEPPADCEPTTLFEAFGIEPVEGCDVIDNTGDTDEGDEDAAGGNPVSEAAKLPGNNREAALAHANERSGGAVEEAHSRHGESQNENRGGGNGKK